VPTFNSQAEYEAAQDFLREHLSPALTGDNWDALIAALAVGDTYNRESARLAFDQFFRSSASGKYLDRRMNDFGVERPTAIGMSDDLFRDLGLKLSNDALTNLALWEVLEIYYGEDTVRANLTSTTAEPYSLVDGDTLIFTIDERTTVTATFKTADFKNITQASALEVAAVINRTIELEGLTAYAVSFSDPTNGQNYVRLHSGALGMVGALRVNGGRAQNALLFPTLVASGASNTQWSVTYNAGTNVVRMTFTGGNDPLFDSVRVGDYVNVYGPTFHAQNRGTFVITAVFLDASLNPRPTWIEFSNPSGFTESITQSSASDVQIFRSTRSDFTPVRISTADPSFISVTLPATTQVVNRTVGEAAYLHATAALSILSLSRDTLGLVTVTTTAPHGLATGGVVFIDGAYPLPDNNPQQWGLFARSMSQVRQKHSVNLLKNGKVLVVGGTDSNGVALSSVEQYDPVTRTWSKMSAMASPRYDHRATVLLDGRLLVTGGSGPGTTIYSSTEIYDPSTNKWVSGGNMVTTRTAHVAVLMGNNRVLVTGGSTGTTYDLYDPATGIWTTNSIPAAIGKYATITILTDTHVLVVGGDTGTASNATYLFVPETLTWSTKATMNVARKQHTATLLADGRVLVLGGANGGGAALNTGEIYDPVANTWTSLTNPLLHSRFDHGVGLLSNGHVLLIGGNTAGAIASVEDLNVTASSSTEVQALNQARYGFGRVVSLGNNRFEVIGGTNGGALATAESYPREVGGGGLNGWFTVTVTSATQFTYQTPDFPQFTTCASGTVTPFAAPDAAGIPGPYIFDPQAGLAMTAISTTLSAAIFAGTQQPILTVANASAFPDEEGWLVIGYGTSGQQGPIRYTSRISPTQLLLDGFTFTSDAAIGADVTFLSQKGPWIPDDVATIGALYVTASPAGRVAASDTIDEIVAAGFKVKKTIVYPGDIGLGGEGWGSVGQKLSDVVAVWSGDDTDAEVEVARES
jgi:N-acetylneuraminic acid mutarotase